MNQENCSHMMVFEMVSKQTGEDRILCFQCKADLRWNKETRKHEVEEIHN